MNFIAMTVNRIKEIQAKEFFIGLFDLLGITVLIGTTEGGHFRITLHLWQFDIEFGLHQWEFNIVKRKSDEAQ